MTSKPLVDHELLEEHVEDLYENAPCGYLSTLEDGTIVKVNQTLLTWLGYERDELLGTKKFQELLSIGGRIFFETHFAPLLKMQGFANEVNFDIVCKNRRQIPVLTSTTQRRRPGGRAVINRITVFNITDRKKYERELLLERKKAEQAARTKADFLSMMSHEIRTPMNAIIGIANLLEQTDLSEVQSEYTSMLKTSSENLMSLLNSILDFSKIESGKVVLDEKDFNLKKLIQNAMRGLESRAKEKDLALRLNFDSQVPEVLVGDAVKIAQVLTNFIGNAVKFTEHGGVDVNVISLGNTQSVASFRIEVADTGIGIAPDRLSRIFDEFTQADSETSLRYGGSGLGLAISCKLVEMYRSKILVKSELGKGSTFGFDLTLKIGVMSEENPVSFKETQGTRALNDLRVLVAEDNASNIFILDRMLKSWGVIVEVVSNGRDALDKVTSSTFDIVLMDLRMPVMDGYEATSRIRAWPDERISQIPIIAFSASTKVGEEDLAEIAAFNDILGKPFRPEDLFTKIAHYTGRSQLPNHEDENKSDQMSESSTAQTEAPEALFTLNVYLKSLEGDRNDLYELIKIVIGTYEEAKIELSRAFHESNLEKFRFQAHRIKSSVEMLRARSLQRSIKQGQNALEQGLPTGEVSKQIEHAFDELIEGLQKAIHQLK